MKNKMIIILMLSLSWGSFSQTYTGIVKDGKNMPIAYANVIAKSMDSVTIAGTITDESGKFEIEVQSETSFHLTISFIGFSKWSEEIDANQDLCLGVITMAESASELDEVVVVGSKPIIERKAGRLVFNVENSVVATGYDAMEALKFAPRIDPTSQGIKMIGKSSLAVMVNDRLLNLDGPGLDSYLKSLRSENIESIEIIMNPPARFDASGNSGLVNIILKKNTNIGFDGSVTSTYVQRTYPGFMPSTYLAYSSDKVLISFNLYADSESKKYESETSIIYPSSNRFSKSERKQDIKGFIEWLKF